MAKRIRKHPISEICRKRPKMGPARNAGRARKPIFIPRLMALEGRTLLATLVVDPAGGTGVFTTIQAAVNAANAAGGDTIQIHPATYTEQVTIDKSLTMVGTGPGVIIQAPSTLTPDLGLDSLVEIKNAADVTISDVTIQGPVPTDITIDAGILVVGGATANVTNSTIAHIRSEPLNNNSGTGYGILVGNLSGTQVGTATITNDTITDYQKNGIAVRGGSSATITDNMIATAGPASVIAQNGIVIYPGATATITGNTITGNQYIGPGGGPDPFNSTQAAGILVFGSASVTGNTVTDNDIGIASNATGAPISGNTIENGFEGVYLLAGTATVSSNTIDGNNIGVALIAFSGDTANADGTLVSNNIFNNGNGVSSFPGAGIDVLAEPGATTLPLLTASFNRIVGNSVGLNNGTTTAADAPLNWWGSNTGPNTTGNDTTTGTGTVNTSPWLVLSIAASPTTIEPSGTSSVTASVTTDSGGETHPTAPFFPDGIPITFGATGGTIDPPSGLTLSGTASATFTAITPGTATASATLDHQTVTTDISVAAVPPLRPPVDLAVTNSAPTSAVTGQDLNYTIVVTNKGPGNESAAHLFDQLPPGVVLVSTSVPPAVDTPGFLEFDLSDLPANASKTIVIIVQPTAAGTLVNQAVVSGIETDTDLSNNVASATTIVAAAPAALAVALVADPSTATVGHELTYTLTVADFGPGPASGVVLTSALPAGAAIVAASQTQGISSISNGVVTTALGGLAAGASATVTIVVIPTVTGTLTTVASVAGNEPNPNPAATVAALSTPVAPEQSTPMADLLVTKTVSPSPGTVGVPLTYTATVTNLGPDAEPAAGITLVDLLPPGVVFVSSSAPLTSETSNSLTYALGGLAAGASESVTIVVLPTAPGSLFNQAVATGVGPDPNLSNNYAEVSVAVHQAPTVVSLTRLGYHTGPTTLDLRFSGPLDPATAVDLRNYKLFQVLKDGHHQAIRIKSATYDPASQTVTLAPARQLYLFGHYQLEVNGTSPTGVSDIYGNLLDGAGTGRPGSNYVRAFGQEVLVGQSPPAGPKAHAAASKAHATAPKAHAAAPKAHAAAHPKRAIAGRRA